MNGVEHEWRRACIVIGEDFDERRRSSSFEGDKGRSMPRRTLLPDWGNLGSQLDDKKQGTQSSSSCRSLCGLVHESAGHGEQPSLVKINSGLERGNRYG